MNVITPFGPNKKLGPPKGQVCGLRSVTAPQHSATGLLQGFYSGLDVASFKQVVPRTTAADLNQIARELLGSTSKLFNFVSRGDEFAMPRQPRTKQVGHRDQLVVDTNRTFNPRWPAEFTRHTQQLRVRVANALLRNCPTAKIIYNRTTRQPMINFAKMQIEVFGLVALFSLCLFAWHVG